MPRIQMLWSSIPAQLAKENKEFKGELTEQYVLQQLKTLKGVTPYYWTADRGTAEVGFVIGGKTG